MTWKRTICGGPFATVGDYNESGGGTQKMALDCVASSILRSIKSLDIPGKTRISGPTQGVSGCFEASTKLSDCQLMPLQGGAKGHLPAGSGMVDPVQMVQCTYMVLQLPAGTGMVHCINGPPSSRPTDCASLDGLRGDGLPLLGSYAYINVPPSVISAS